MKAALHKMTTTPGYTREDAIDERIAFFEYQIWMESTTLKVKKKLLAEITDLKQQLEDMNNDIVTATLWLQKLKIWNTLILNRSLRRSRPHRSQAETDANPAKQAAVSKKKAATKLRSRLRFMSRRKPSRRRRRNSRVIVTQVDRFGQGHVSD